MDKVHLQKLGHEYELRSQVFVDFAKQLKEFIQKNEIKTLEFIKEKIDEIHLSFLCEKYVLRNEFSFEKDGFKKRSFIHTYKKIDPFKDEYKEIKTIEFDKLGNVRRNIDSQEWHWNMKDDFEEILSYLLI